MPAIKLEAFRGEQPRIIARQLPGSGAQAALNVRLDDGGLTPIRRSVAEAVAGGADHLAILRFNDAWLSNAAAISAAEGAVDSTRLYYTGDGAPKLRKLDGTIYALALPAPTPALTATLGSSGSGDVVTRIYAYTWVTDLGEESEPCAASAAIDWQPGHTVTLSGFASTPADRGITLQRIYRSQTGTSGTYFYLIAERAASSSDFSDTVAVDAFQEPLPSADWNPPPDALEGLVSMSNGIAAGFVGRSVYFSEPFRWHAWPEKYVQQVDADIVGIAAINSVLFILTKGHPYFASGSVPEAMQLDRSPANMACIGARGIANLGFAVCYPANDGLAIARPDGSVGLVSASLFNAEQWKAYDPATMIGSQHQGRYVGFYSVTSGDQVIEGCMAIEVAGEPFLSFASATATAAFFDLPSAALYYLRKGTDDIVRFDAPNGARARQYWRSKPFILPYPENFGAIRVDSDIVFTNADALAAAAVVADAIAANELLIAAGGLSGEINATALNGGALNGDILEPIPGSGNTLAIGIYANGTRVATVTATNDITRLPSGFLAEKWEIDVSGDIPITQIVMAKTMNELKRT